MEKLKKRATVFLVVLLLIATAGSSIAIFARLNAKEEPVSITDSFGEYFGEYPGKGYFAGHPYTVTFDAGTYDYLTFSNLTTDNKFSIITDLKSSPQNSYAHIVVSKILTNLGPMIGASSGLCGSDCPVDFFTGGYFEFDIRIPEYVELEEVRDKWFLRCDVGQSFGVRNACSSVYFEQLTDSNLFAQYYTLRFNDTLTNYPVDCTLRYGHWYNLRLEYGHAEAFGSVTRLYIDNSLVGEWNTEATSYGLAETVSIVPRAYAPGLQVDIDNFYASRY